MTPQDLNDLRDAIHSLRMIQSSAFVAAGLSDTNDARAYLERLARLDSAITNEIDPSMPLPFSGTESTGHQE